MSASDQLSSYPRTSAAPLIVYLDIKSPYAFIAKDPTWALADELGLALDVRPLTLDIPSYLGSARLDKKGKVAEANRSKEQWSGVRYAYMDARRYASAYGYGLRGTEKIWDTRLIHIALLWVKRSGTDAVRRFLDAAYPLFWLRDLDVEDPDVVVNQIVAAGVDATGFVAWADGAGGVLHDQQQQAIFESGIYGVPGYVLTGGSGAAANELRGDYFFGREHLALLRDALAGRAHSLADIANPLPPLAEVAARGEGKHNVFLAMQHAAATGSLEIVAGVNSACAASRIAIERVALLLAEYPDRLTVRWAELPQRVPKAVAEPASSAGRGDWHRAHRSNYQAADLARYVRMQGVEADSRTLSDGSRTQDDGQNLSDIDAELPESADQQLLVSNGVTESFGFVFVDSQQQVHPFLGRQHLSVLKWALDAT